MTDYSIQSIPKSRMATIDVCELGRRKHHIAALLEIDVTESRTKIRKYRQQHTEKTSFTAWMLKAVSETISKHSSVAAYLKGNDKLQIFTDVNLSVVVEKDHGGHKVPFPVVIEKAQAKNMVEIGREIEAAKVRETDKDSIVLQRRSSRMERLYYHLPGLFRRTVWRFLLRHPGLIFPKMGNVAVTSLGGVGKVNGWFIPLSVHPVCFGFGSVLKKPLVVNDRVEIREVMNLTVLLDHDVVDGAPMTRFISDLTKNIESGLFL